MAVAYVTRITVSSPASFQDAISDGAELASRTLRGISNLQVVAQNARFENGHISEYRATLEVSFNLQEAGVSKETALPREIDAAADPKPDWIAHQISEAFSSEPEPSFRPVRFDREVE